MSNDPKGRRGFIRCTKCGEVMTGSVTQDGDLVPVGVENGGKCGDAEFEVITMPETTSAEGQT